jgi:hypothetical protein
MSNDFHSLSQTFYRPFSLFSFRNKRRKKKRHTKNKTLEIERKK